MTAVTRPSGLSVLRRLATPEPPAPQPPAVEKCEFCAEPVPPEHRHVVDVDRQRLLCACTGCALLFTSDGAGGGRRRTVPDRYLHDPAIELSDRHWDALQIPVGIAFFFRPSHLGRVAAFYPSPAGATESTLDLADWASVGGAAGPLAEFAPDVEAMLVHRLESRDALARRYEAFLVPIDTCYELVGLIRLHWKGFDGGEEARTGIAEFFDRLRARSRRPA